MNVSMGTRNLHSLFRISLLIFVGASLSACIAQSQVQGRYIDAQENCREAAEETVAKHPQTVNMTQDQQNIELVNQFSICMNQSGWHVANPLKPKGPVVATTDSVPGVTQTEMSSSLARQPTVTVQTTTKSAGPATTQTSVQTVAPQPAPRMVSQPVMNQAQQPATTAAPSASNIPSDIAPPAQYERITGSPAASPGEDRAGRQF